MESLSLKLKALGGSFEKWLVWMELDLSRWKMAWADAKRGVQVHKGMLYTWLMQDKDMHVLCVIARVDSY